MAVNWSLAGPGFNALQTLQVAGQAAQQAAAERQRVAAEQQREAQAAARQAAASQLSAGNYDGATTTALQSGDFDLVKQIGGLHDDHRKKLASEAEVIGRVAFGLKSVPAAERGARFQAIMPILQQQGFTPEELQGIDLSDAGLDGYLFTSQSVKDALAAQLAQTRIADVTVDNQRADQLARNTMTNTQVRLGLARNADARGAASNARAAEARGEGRVRFRERDKDRAAIAAGGRGLRTDTSDLDY